MPLARWRRIVEATVDQAERGNPKAREWLARYLLGEAPPSLVAIAAEAAEGIPIGDTALLARLVSAREDAGHRRLVSGSETEAAEKILAHLARPADELSGAGQTGASDALAPPEKGSDGGIATGSVVVG